MMQDALTDLFLLWKTSIPKCACWRLGYSMLLLCCTMPYHVWLIQLLSPLQVMWVRLHQKEAFQDFGTLQQLQSLINRSNVPVKPKNITSQDAT